MYPIMLIFLKLSVKILGCLRSLGSISSFSSLEELLAASSSTSSLDRRCNYHCTNPLLLNLIQISLHFNFNLDTLTANWTIYIDWTPSIGSKNPTNLSS
jgi:hypothetical protein